MEDHRQELWDLMMEHVDYWEHSHDKAVDVIIKAGWRPIEGFNDGD